MKRKTAKISFFFLLIALICRAGQLILGLNRNPSSAFGLYIGIVLGLVIVVAAVFAAGLRLGKYRRALHELNQGGVAYMCRPEYGNGSMFRILVADEDGLKLLKVKGHHHTETLRQWPRGETVLRRTPVQATAVRTFEGISINEPNQPETKFLIYPSNAGNFTPELRGADLDQAIAKLQHPYARPTVASPVISNVI